MNTSTPLNGCEINVHFCLIYKSSYVLRSVSVHWMYQNVRIRSSFMISVQLIMHCLNSFLPCSIRNLTFASLSRLFTIKIDVLALFTSFNSHSGLFPAITENQLHDFLINSRHSSRNIVYTITRHLLFCKSVYSRLTTHQTIAFCFIA